MKRGFARMKDRWVTVFAGAALVLALTMGTNAAFAATGPSGPQGRTWDEVKSLPDWAGVWVSQSLPKAAGWPLNDKGKAQAAALAKLRQTNGDVPSRSKQCQVSGLPGGMSGPEEYTEEFIFTPGQVTLTQTQGFARRIYTEIGRAHV